MHSNQFSLKVMCVMFQLDLFSVTDRGNLRFHDHVSSSYELSYSFELVN